MADSKQAITSLLTEHFRYTPLTLLDDIINTVNELVYRAVNAVEEGLSNAPAHSLGFADRFTADHPNETPETDDQGCPVFPEARTEIENGVHQLETLLQAAVDKNFDKLEIYVLRNILCVPQDLAPWMRLAHYEKLTIPAANTSSQLQSQDTPTPESLYLLRRKLTEARKLELLLQSQRSRNAALISRLQNLLFAPPARSSTPDQLGPSLAFLTSVPAAEPFSLSFNNTQPVLPLTSHARSVASQLPALRQLVVSLRAQSQLLQESDGRMKHPGNAADTERREYIESRVKKKLESEGMRLRAGDTAEGSTDRPHFGRRRDEDEIGDIERVVGLLSSGTEGERDKDGRGNDVMQVDK